MSDDFEKREGLDLNITLESIQEEASSTEKITQEKDEWVSEKLSLIDPFLDPEMEDWRKELKLKFITSSLEDIYQQHTRIHFAIEKLSSDFMVKSEIEQKRKFIGMHIETIRGHLKYEETSSVKTKVDRSSKEAFKTIAVHTGDNPQSEYTGYEENSFLENRLIKLEIEKLDQDYWELERGIREARRISNEGGHVSIKLRYDYTNSGKYIDFPAVLAIQLDRDGNQSTTTINLYYRNQKLYRIWKNLGGS